jgi:hypothetical protein
MYISNAIRSASSLQQFAAIINDGGTCEGMEGIEFTPEQLAGQYAFEAARDSGWPIDAAAIAAHLEVLADAGAEFGHTEAAEHSMALAGGDAFPLGVCLTQDPYIIEGGYKAVGYLDGEDRSDETCPTVTVVWALVDGWEDRDDESDCCDWGRPASVTHCRLGDITARANLP